jgi:hypothetical protein
MQATDVATNSLSITEILCGDFDEAMTALLHGVKAIVRQRLDESGREGL